MKIKIVLACLYTAGSMNGFSQQYLKVSAGGGISTIQYSSAEISSDLLAPSSIGGGILAEYLMFFNQYVGASIGVGISMAQSKYELDCTLNEKMPNYSFDDNTTKDFVYNAEFDNWEESQMIHTIDIPIGTMGKYSFSEKITAMAALGVKCQLPIKATYKVDDEGERRTTGYFSDANVVVSDIPHQGFYTLDGGQEGNLNTKSIAFAAYCDLGIIHKIGKQSIYYGIYGQYGLTQINAETENVFLNRWGGYDSPLNTTAIDKCRLLSFGVKLGYMLPMKYGQHESMSLENEFEQVSTDRIEVSSESED
ncbi:MAG: hypothetical protein MJZ33_07335 [Paludibacteraceae bacterium]|nr:hypothetical protein [Paludibacteraceae bacterium]